MPVKILFGKRKKIDRYINGIKSQLFSNSFQTSDTKLKTGRKRKPNSRSKLFLETANIKP